MTILLALTTPFQDPILSITLIFLIILLSPILLKRLRIPGIIGMIIAGVLIGPFGFHLIKGNSLELFSKIGLLYIMFLAGLEIDLTEFAKNKLKSLVFGALTFFIPLGIGFFVARNILHFEPIAALLVASMFSTHTLLAYPIASKQNITKNEAVIVTIGGTLITDTAVLLLLSVISNMVQGGIDTYFWTRMISLFIVFIFAIIWLVPKITRWIFKRFNLDGSVEYLLVMAILFISSLIAEFIGIEAIIGAFLCGLALNRVIPHSSALMNRTVFIGNTLFIPFFLIEIGMKVNMQIVIYNSNTWIFSATLITVALFTKWLAAWVTQKIYRYSSIERNLIFGLSSAHAAAILAVVVIGIKLNLLDNMVLNGTVLLILITCFVSSFVTEINGRKQAVIESNKVLQVANKYQKILIPIANPDTINRLLTFAMLIRDKKSTLPIYPLSVVLDSDDLNQKIVQTNYLLRDSLEKASATGTPIKVTHRVDLNIAGGIIRAAREMNATELLMGWTKNQTTSRFLFENTLDNVIKNTGQTAYIAKLDHPVRTYQRIVVAVPEKADLEIGFPIWIKNLVVLCNEISAKCIFLCSDISIEYIGKKIDKMGINLVFEHKLFENWNDITIAKKYLQSDDLFLIISARKKAISYSKFFSNIPNILVSEFSKYSFILVYPEQTISEIETNERLDGVATSPITENLERINKFGKSVIKVIKGVGDKM